MFAVKRNGLALQYVKEQTEKIECYLEAVKHYYALRYVKDQTEKIECYLEAYIKNNFYLSNN